MKRLSVVLCGLMLAALPTTSALAETLTFDDVPGYQSLLASGYHGLNWNNIYVEDGSTSSGTGYNTGIVSGSNVIFNGYGHDASFSAGSGTLTLNSFYLTEAFASSNITVVVTGLLAGN